MSLLSTSRSESGGGDGLLFLLPLPRDFPSEARRNRSESESLMGVDGLWIVLYSPAGRHKKLYQTREKKKEKKKLSPSKLEQCAAESVYLILLHP